MCVCVYNSRKSWNFNQCERLQFADLLCVGNPRIRRKLFNICSQSMYNINRRCLVINTL